MRVLGISVFIVFIDQATKLLVKANFELEESIAIVGDFLRFTYIENPGMAFGLQFAGPFFLTAFSLIASVVVLYYLYKLRHEALKLRIPLALILGGAVGNLIDRFLYGRVVDFIEVGVGEFRWPVFNVADSSVTIGMVFLIALILLEKEEGKQDTSTLKMKEPNPADSEERDIWNV